MHFAVMKPPVYCLDMREAFLAMFWARRPVHLWNGRRKCAQVG
jgi:hypothetical protein